MDIIAVALSVGVFQLVVKVIQRLQAGVLLEEDVAFDEVGNCFRGLVFGENTDRHAENLVKLFEGALLGLAIDEVSQLP